MLYRCSCCQILPHADVLSVPFCTQTPESMMQRLLDRIEGFGIAESTTFRT